MPSTGTASGTGARATPTTAPSAVPTPATAAPIRSSPARWSRPSDRVASVCNVGAGAGSYEPTDRRVVAVEPSATMRSQRPAGSAPVVAATAESLPFAAGAFDAAMTTFSVHQWGDLAAGLAELRRVGRHRAVVLTVRPGPPRPVLAAGRTRPRCWPSRQRRYPGLDRLASGLGGSVRRQMVPGAARLRRRIQRGLLRPSRDPCWTRAPVGRVRRGASWTTTVVARFEQRLAGDLASGRWDERWGHLRHQPTYEGSLVLVVAEPELTGRRAVGWTQPVSATGMGAASSSAACSGFTMLMSTPVPSSKPATVVSFGTTCTCQWYGSGARYGAEWKTRL